MTALPHPFARRPADGAETSGTLDRLLTARLSLSWVAAAVVVIFLVAVALRFYALGDRAIHHDESLHSAFSWYFYKGAGYIHDPLMHGPFLFHAMAFVYGLAGATDATARVVPAAFGSVLVLLPLLLRGRLGGAGTVAAALLLAVSPTMLYFSRFVGAGAQDIILAVTTLLIAAAAWRYLDDGRSRWLYLLAAALSLSFATKEVTFIVAVVFLLWLNGLAAVQFAAQRGGRGPRRALETALLLPVAWLLAVLWPALGGARERLRLTTLPRSADLVLLLGLLTAPQFAAAVQVPLGRLGYDMASASRVSGMSNEQLFGGATVGLLIAATTIAGIAWRRRDFLICAALFWAIYAVLFTTFFVNNRGFATGIWGSLDYWLAQQGEERGKQPVFYYAVLTPVYEYLPLLLALAGIVRTAVLGRWRTSAALVAGAIALVVDAAGIEVAIAGREVALGGDDIHGAPLALVAIVMLLVALRHDLFRSFLAFWAAAVFFGLSVAGEKMPWLEVHIALPLILLAALTIDDVAGAARRALPGLSRARVAASPPALAFIAVVAGGTLAAALLWPGDASGRIPLLVALGAGVVLATLPLVAVSRPLAVAAFGAAALALLLPLTVRDALRASFVHADTPRDMLIYTQTSPALRGTAEQIDRLARESGQGRNLAITIDASDAFTWPWAWYLRDYKNVNFIDLSTFPASELPKQRPGAVLVTALPNAGAAEAWPGLYGPGERIPHRWWFPEEVYRSTTTRRFWNWLRDPETLGRWAAFFLDRETPYEIGSVDAVAFFPPDFVPEERRDVPRAFRPRPDGERLIVGGPGSSPGALRDPAALALDASGNILVADRGNNRVQRFSPSGRLLSVSSENARLERPSGVAAAADGAVYVLDAGHSRVVRLTRGLSFLTSWGGPPAAGDRPPGPMELSRPSGIAVDTSGNVWVADTGHDRLVVYDRDGRPLATHGRTGSGAGEFIAPAGLAFDGDGTLYVADRGNNRVQRFDADFTPLSEFEVGGWDAPDLDPAPSLAALPDGALAVTLPARGRVERVGEGGRGRLSEERFGPRGAAVRPAGVVLDREGRLWVSDSTAGLLIRLAPRQRAPEP